MQGRKLSAVMPGASHYHIDILVSDILVSRSSYRDLFPTSHSRFYPCPVPTLKRERTLSYYRPNRADGPNGSWGWKGNYSIVIFSQSSVRKSGRSSGAIDSIVTLRKRISLA